MARTVTRRRPTPRYRASSREHYESLLTGAFSAHSRSNCEADTREGPRRAKILYSMDIARALALYSFLIAIASTTTAQPVIRPSSVVNAASNLTSGLPNYGIARGGMFILKGQHLGMDGVFQASSFPLPTDIKGTSMKITIAGTTVDVVMVYVFAGQSTQDDQGSYDQLAGIVPSFTPTGGGTIVVTYNGQSSPPVPILVVASQFGIFTINQQGTGPGVFTDQDGKVNTLTSAAHAGDRLSIWGTGLGAINGDDAAAPPRGNLDVPLAVYVANVKVVVDYHGRSGCCSGIDQITFTVPPVAQGCYVSLAVTTGNKVSNFTSLSIAAGGNSTCSDPTGLEASELKNVANGAAMNVADINFARFTLMQGSVQTEVDKASAKFRNYQPGAMLGSSRGGIATFEGFPSAGCLVFPYVASSQTFINAIFPAEISDNDYRRLNAGAFLRVYGPPSQGVTQFSGAAGKTPSGIVNTNYGPEYWWADIPPLFSDYYHLLPGSYELNATGGVDVGAFSSALTIPESSLVWTNRDIFLNRVPRSQDLPLTWSGVGGGMVAVLGNSISDQGVGAQFFCVSPDATGGMTIPAWVLSALPASSASFEFAYFGGPSGFLGVANMLSGPTRFRAPGIDAGYFNWGDFQIKNLSYQ
jgi:uncharacterized protein (TIGR03437 family)